MMDIQEMIRWRYIHGEAHKILRRRTYCELQQSLSYSE